MNKALALLVALILIAPFASAGTLISGSTVNVESNYEGFSGLSLVGTWSTTPATSDIIVIEKDELESPYFLENRVTVNIPAPTFEQVFTVSQQFPLKRAIYAERTYFYFNAPGGLSASELCQEDWEADLQATYNGKSLWPGTQAQAVVANAWCTVVFALEDRQDGWMGAVVHKGWNYKQDVVFSNGQRLTLDTTTEVPRVSDSISNFGKATLLNFGQWTNARLTDDDIYGYHQKNALGTSSWRPFEDLTGISVYKTRENQLIEVLGRDFNRVDAYNGNFELMKSEAKLAINQLNVEETRLLGKSTALPSDWSNGDLNAMRTVANDIIVPIKRTILTANIQLVMKGDRFGLIIPTGEPQIVSAGSSLRFEETSSGQLSYTVKNKGSATGTFVVSSECSPAGIVEVDEVFMTLNAGQSQSGQLRHTAKTNINDDQQISCTLVMEETNTHERATKAYTVTVEAKASCVEGQETDPFISGDKWIVRVLDSNCNTKNEKTCLVATGHFEKKDGVYVCVDNDGGGGGGGPTICANGKDDDEDGLIDLSDPGCTHAGDNDERDEAFSVVLFIVAGVIALIGGGAAYGLSSGLAAIPKAGKYIRIGVAVVVAGLLFFGVPWVWGKIIEWFSTIPFFG